MEHLQNHAVKAPDKIICNTLNFQSLHPLTNECDDNTFDLLKAMLCEYLH